VDIGDKVRIETSSGGIYLYRPNSDVLVYSQSESRAFEKVDACKVEIGMEILALGQEVREAIRQALAGSKKVLEQIRVYHSAIETVRNRIPGNGLTDKARNIVQRMQRIDPTTRTDEIANVRRWIIADKAATAPDGGRRPGAARDFSRFQLFCRAVDINEAMIEPYWLAAISSAKMKTRLSKSGACTSLYHLSGHYQQAGPPNCITWRKNTLSIAPTKVLESANKRSTSPRVREGGES
jgi:hypothetical protein